MYEFILTYATMSARIALIVLFVFISPRTCWRFLTDQAFATQVMVDWFDRVSDAWCDTSKAVADGAMRWTHYDSRLSVFAVRQMLGFRIRARLTLIHCWVFGVVDRLTLRLGVAGEPKFCQRCR